MLLKHKLSLLILVVSFSPAMCQLTKHDSLAIIKQAGNDSKSFKLEKSAWKKYKHSLTETSDYFKPNAIDVKETNLLNDSLYVTAYRKGAFKQNSKRRTAGHYVLFGVGIAAAVFAAFIIAVIMWIAPTMG